MFGHSFFNIDSLTNVKFITGRGVNNVNPNVHKLKQGSVITFPVVVLPIAIGTGIEPNKF